MYIEWDEDDQIYVVTIPDFMLCKTDGKTYEEAVKNAQEVIDLCIETELLLGQPVPQPHSYGLVPQGV
jgi:predicted RNase H-like HicB family nuclease